MKLFIFFYTIFFSTQLIAKSPLHLDLEMDSKEYKIHLKTFQKNNLINFQNSDHPAISRALKLGERLSNWISLINNNRSPEQAIRLTSASTRRGIPIDSPNMYSPSIIEKETRKILTEFPQEMKEVITSRAELPSSIKIDDQTFIEHARKLDRNYQAAARYKSVDRYRASYIEEANRDVRGYYYLKKNNISENDLYDLSHYSQDEKQKIENALTLVCLNSLKNLKRCQKEFEKASEKNELFNFYKMHIMESKKNWDEFFKIPKYAIREDINWSGKAATIPFNIPTIAKFIPYLRNNVEDEFKWHGWKLEIIFGNYPSAPYLKFEPGVVPHVNELGGNEIVMDSNQPIEEYESQWTIRHEFGHILGLPDCYHEFYDVKAKAYVNYQLDTTDLMCSRAGNMKKRIYEELKKAYGK